MCDMAESASTDPQGGEVFVVERTLLATSRADLAALHRALAEASRRLSANGGTVRYLGSTYIPARDRSISIFAACSELSVRRVIDMAQVSAGPVEQALHFGHPTISTRPSPQ
jgi:hypothetical protein